LTIVTVPDDLEIDALAIARAALREAEASPAEAEITGAGLEWTCRRFALHRVVKPTWLGPRPISASPV